MQKILPLLFCLNAFSAFSQIQDHASKKTMDSLYILEIEEKENPPKVLHAEPLYIDLIRDLGARKGEKEWNLGVGLTDMTNFDSYEALIEYEFAVIDRLGLEFEVPFLFYSPQNGLPNDSLPGNKLESFKMATQWTFFVSEEMATSLALGYIHEFELAAFRNYDQEFWKGNIFNPFVVAAKRWGQNFHTLIYTGPRIEKAFDSAVHTSFEINTNFHYMVPGTRNFIGVEFNKLIEDKQFDMTIRPQMRLGITDDFMIGIVAGVPISRENERFSMFTRLIWEPGHAY